ncbi:MAG: ATP synthase F1 subunit gamma [Prolixibacteraceae bacterium]|jgi:F-type H+-transporting ATPase subunit gamma|nr:ATP synthase F1 subunit gamma [Prolixibacteraceae bacterium]
MAQLKEIRSRIASIKNTRQVTSAMKMVSAAKLKKAQDAILQITPYDKKLHEILQNLSLGEVEFNSVFFSEPEVENVLLVVIGSNRGLCGGFNTNVSKFALLQTADNYKHQLKTGNVKFLPVGRQVEKALKSRKVEIYNPEHDLLNEHDYNAIATVAQQLMDLFSSGKYQRIDIVYNKFKNAGVQELTSEQFLPIPKPEEDELGTTRPDYIFEPTQEEILTSLIPQSLKMSLFRIILDSNAAENGARMTAMHQATDNATEMLKELQTKYNNARQAAITNEILEITAGAEALKG